MDNQCLFFDDVSLMMEAGWFQTTLLLLKEALGIFYVWSRSTLFSRRSLCKQIWMNIYINTGIVRECHEWMIGDDRYLHNQPLNFIWRKLFRTVSICSRPHHRTYFTLNLSLLNSLCTCHPLPRTTIEWKHKLFYDRSDNKKENQWISNEAEIFPYVDDERNSFLLLGQTSSCEFIFSLR